VSTPNNRFWSATILTYLLVLLAFVLTMYLVFYKEIDGEALGLVIGVWLREGLGTVFNILTKKTGSE
jgi:uncharacterized membrane protein YqaE (UPF0057 family)